VHSPRTPATTTRVAGRLASPRVPVDGRAGVLGTDRCPTAIYHRGPREIPAPHPIWCRRRVAAACGLPTWAAYARSRRACMCHVAADLPPRHHAARSGDWRCGAVVRCCCTAFSAFVCLFRCPHRASLFLSLSPSLAGTETARGGIFLLASRHLVSRQTRGEKRRLSGRNTNPPCLFLSPVCHLFLGW
jgi:hypothetical protein